MSSPLCCNSAIPYTLRYAMQLLPKSTIHTPLAKGEGFRPLLTCFLAYISNNNGPTPNSVPKGYSSIFFVIVQVKRTQPLGQAGQGTGLGTGNEKGKQTQAQMQSPYSSSSTQSIITNPTLRQLTSFSSHAPSISSSSTTPTPPARTSISSTRYFAPLERSTQASSIDQFTPLFGRTFREIETRVAMESLRLPGCGIEIGDGEAWKGLDGVETLWCESHRCWFEMRIWVRDE